MNDLRKLFLFIYSIVCVIFVACIEKKQTIVKPVEEDTIVDPYYRMSREEFMQEMKKGVQGDFTAEQADSIMELLRDK